MFITFEGPNGVGKTTTLIAVKEQLIMFGFDVVQTKEPTNSELGIFLKNSEELYSGECLACLAAADRYFHLKQEITPALITNKIILSDRYVESSLVLQRLDGCTLDFIWGLNAGIAIPDLSFILLASPNVINKRLASRVILSRFERNNLREDELRLYGEAGDFISRRGFNVIFIDSDKIPFEFQVRKIIQEIQKLLKI